MMNKVRVPKRLIPHFKEFCKRFAHSLQDNNNIRLRGNHLLNTMATAAGHKSYKALLIDSGTYGEGPFDWDMLLTFLAPPLSVLLNVSVDSLSKPLMVAVLGESLAIIEINHKMDSSINPFSLKQLTHKLSLPEKKSEEYWSVFGNGQQEVDFLDVLSQQENPVIDISLANDMEDGEKIILLKLLAENFLKMNHELQRKVIFLGNDKDIQLLVQANPKAAPSLLQNISISARGADTIGCFSVK